jgi:small-conductance mechanosensitive channel
MIQTAVPDIRLDWITGLGSITVLVVAYLLARTATISLTRLSDRMVERRITIRMLIPVVKSVIYGGAIFYILGPLLQLSSAQVLAVSGLLGAALGFGLKDLFANVIGGFVITFERPYRVGDKVELGEYYGEVMDIGLRSTKLVTPDDTLVSVPNYLFFTESVANANAGNAEMLVVTEFYVDPETDVQRAMAIVEEALVTSPYVYISADRPYTVLVEDSTHYRTIRGKAYVNDHRNESAFKSDVTERVCTAYDAEGIQSPRVTFGGHAEAPPS